MFIIDSIADIALNSCIHAVIESWSLCFSVQWRFNAVRENYAEGPKRTSCQQLLTHFSKSEPSGLAIQFRRKSSRCERACAWGVMRSTVNFVLLEEVFKMSSSALIKGSISYPLLHQQSGFCPPMQIGLDSKEALPSSSRHSMGSVFRPFQWGKQNGRDPALFEASESGSSKAQLKVFEYLASLPVEAEERGEGRRGTPADRCFSSHKNSDPEEPFTFMSDWRMEPCRGLRRERSLF